MHPTGCPITCRTRWCNLQGASGAPSLSECKECVLESVAGSVGVTGVPYRVSGGPVRVIVVSYRVPGGPV